MSLKAFFFNWVHSTIRVYFKHVAVLCMFYIGWRLSLHKLHRIKHIIQPVYHVLSSLFARVRQCIMLCLHPNKTEPSDELSCMPTIDVFFQNALSIRELSRSADRIISRLYWSSLNNWPLPGTRRFCGTRESRPSRFLLNRSYTVMFRSLHIFNDPRDLEKLIFIEVVEIKCLKHCGYLPSKANWVSVSIILVLIIDANFRTNRCVNRIKRFAYIKQHVKIYLLPALE